MKSNIIRKKLRSISIKEYDFLIIGGGIAGCSAAYFFCQKGYRVAIVEKTATVAGGASGAAGAFLSPMIGKPNKFKDLVTAALKYSLKFYKENAADLIVNKGVLRLPTSDKEFDFSDLDNQTDFEYELKDGGVFFPIGTLINSVGICELLSKEADKILDYEVKSLEYDNGWIIDKDLKGKSIILAIGADKLGLEDDYLNIRGVWGQRINILSSTVSAHNFHKECSISPSFPQENGKNFLSIGATHHRMSKEEYEKVSPEEDTETLLGRASKILELKDVEVVGYKRGARASSIDYFPIVGELVDSAKTLEEFPYIKKGSKVPPSDYIRYRDLYILNGFGGRGFVFGPYLANELVNHITEKQELQEEIKTDRLFTRWARRAGE